MTTTPQKTNTQYPITYSTNYNYIPLNNFPSQLPSFYHKYKLQPTQNLPQQNQKN